MSCSVSKAQQRQVQYAVLCNIHIVRARQPTPHRRLTVANEARCARRASRQLVRWSGTIPQSVVVVLNGLRVDVHVKRQSKSMTQTCEYRRSSESTGVSDTAA